MVGGAGESVIHLLTGLLDSPPHLVPVVPKPLGELGPGSYALLERLPQTRTRYRFRLESRPEPYIDRRGSVLHPVDVRRSRNSSSYTRVRQRIAQAGVRMNSRVPALENGHENVPPSAKPRWGHLEALLEDFGDAPRGARSAANTGG